MIAVALRNLLGKAIKFLCVTFRSPHHTKCDATIWVTLLQSVNVKGEGRICIVLQLIWLDWNKREVITGKLHGTPYLIDPMLSAFALSLSVIPIIFGLDHPKMKKHHISTLHLILPLISKHTNYTFVRLNALTNALDSSILRRTVLELRGYISQVNRSPYSG